MRKTTMNMKRLLQAAAFSVVVSAAYSPVLADDGKLIISGDPVAAATEDSCIAASAATSLNTGTLSVFSAAVPLETRYRTSDESDGIALRSDRFVATIVIVR